MGSRKTPPGTVAEPATPATPEACQEWRLPSGEDLISFAMSTGFTVHPLFQDESGPDVENTKSGRPAKVRAERGGEAA